MPAWQRSEAEGEAARQLQAIQYATDVALLKLPLNELLCELLRRVREILQVDTATILLVTADGRNLAARASQGIEEQAGGRALVPLGRGIAGRIAATRQPLSVEDLSQEEVYRPILHKRIRSLLGVPLLADGRLIGVMHVGTVQPRRFDQADTHLLQVVAERAAAAIEQARLSETEQRAQAEAEARRQVTDILESITDAFYALDREWRFTYVNRQAERIWQRRREELLGRNVWVEFPETVPMLLRPYQKVLREQKPLTFEMYYTPAQGWAEVHAYPSRGGLAVYFQNITERKRAETERQRLHEEVERRVAQLDAVIASAPDGLAIYGPQGEVLILNAVAAAMYGLPPDVPKEQWARRMEELRFETPAGAPFPREELPLMRALRGETVHEIALIVHRPDEVTLWLAASGAPIRTVEGEMLGAVVVLRDITAQHKLEEQRDDMVRAVSHDLRSPLAAVQGQAELLIRRLERAGLGGREREPAEAIVGSAKRMNSMIQDLVDSARMEAGQLRLERQAVELEPFVRELLAQQAPSLDVRRVQVETAEGLPPVYADPDRLARILANLLTNALKYSAPETRVTISFRWEGDWVVTAVRDRGVGIAPEELPKLFQRYYRAASGRERREGLGLGLYITQLLVKAHGGRIWVESEVGVGSVFSFSLPVAA